MAILRMLGALLVVLGLLGAALWFVRRFDVRLPGRVGGGAMRRLEIVERAAIDSRRSVALLRRDGREHLIILSPEGNLVIEAGIVRDEIDQAAAFQRQLEAEEQRRKAEEAMAAAKAELETMRASFADMVGKRRAGLRGNLVRMMGATRTRTAIIQTKCGQLRLRFLAQVGPVLERAFEKPAKALGQLHQSTSGGSETPVVKAPRKGSSRPVTLMVAKSAQHVSKAPARQGRRRRG